VFTATWPKEREVGETVTSVALAKLESRVELKRRNATVKHTSSVLRMGGLPYGYFGERSRTREGGDPWTARKPVTNDSVKGQKKNRKRRFPGAKGTLSCF
jgi:hypothetical protein